MAKYTHAALIAALSLNSFSSVAAFTSTNTISRRFKALEAKTVDPYSTLESSVLSSKGVETAASSSAAANIDTSNVNLDSVFAPIQSALNQIIETEKALNNMEHTAVSNTAKVLLNILTTFDSFTAGVSNAVLGLLDIPYEKLKSIIDTSIQAAQTYATNVDQTLLNDPTIGPILNEIQTNFQKLSPIIGEELASLPPSVGILASAGITYGIISTTLSIGEGPPPSSPYPLGRYDPSSARAYFDKRPLEVISRAVEIASLSTKFGLGLLKDYLDKSLEKNQDKRALELAELLTVLGPTFSKYEMNSSYFCETCI